MIFHYQKHTVLNYSWLIKSGFKKGVFLHFSSTEFEISLAVSWNGLGAGLAVLYISCHLGVSFLRGSYWLGEHYMVMREWDTL